VITTALLVLATIASDTTLRLPRGGTVEVDAGFRNVTLTVGTGDQVTVTGADVELEGDRITIDAGGFPGSRRANEPVRITVPSWASVEVDVMSGTLEVLRVPESLIAEVMNGAITTRGGTGTMQLASVVGGITVRDFAGSQLDVEAITGPVTIDGATGRIRAATVNDPLFLRNIRSAVVDASSINGRVEWSGDFAAGGRYRFETHNGPIELLLPAAVSARMHVTTFMGGFNSALAATTNGKGRPERATLPGGQDITAVYGAGGAEVFVETFHGGVRVRQMGVGGT
jgi:DUF4097 and DUF4098 domain-containing protein YvlB